MSKLSVGKLCDLLRKPDLYWMFLKKIFHPIVEVNYSCRWRWFICLVLLKIKSNFLWVFEGQEKTFCWWRTITTGNLRIWYFRLKPVSKTCMVLDYSITSEIQKCLCTFMVLCCCFLKNKVKIWVRFRFEMNKPDGVFH